MKAFRSRMFIIALGILLLFFFSNDFGIIDVEKTAIVTAIGIDKKGENYEITTQIAVPQASNTTTENAKAVISGEGKTIASAIAEIGKVTGWYPKLAFCNLIIVGENMLETDVNDALDYFARTLKIQYSAIIGASKGSAKELMKIASPLDNISSFALQKVLLEEHSSNVNVTQVDLNKFATGYYGYNGISFLPLIKSVSPSDDGGSGESGGQGGQGSSGGSQDSSGSSGGENRDTGGSGGSAGSGSGGGSSGGDSNSADSSSKTSKDAKVFDASTTLVFKKGRYVCSLNKEQTLTFNMLKKSAKNTVYDVDDVVIYGQKVNFVLNVLSNKHSIKLKFKNQKPVLYIKEKFHVVLEGQDSTIRELALKELGFTPNVVLVKAKEKFEKNILEIIEISKTYGVDIFNLDQQLYRFNHKYYDEYKDSIYESMAVDIDVDFDSYE